MKVRLLIAFGLCLSLTMPALAQGPDGQQHQQQQQKKSTKKSTQQKQVRSQPRTQQQQPQQQNRPQVQQKNQQRTQPQTQRQQVSPQNRQRFTAPNAPPRITRRNEQPRYYRAPDGRYDRRPIYRNGVWYGRAAPNDSRFRLRRPFAYGHFLHYGPHFYHRIVRFNRAHYWFWLSSGYYFQVAYWDWSYCSNWCWTCGDEYLIYLDPDHYGWYLILNPQTGVYVHATFMGMWR
jgi:hypothetical protein